MASAHEGLDPHFARVQPAYRQVANQLRDLILGRTLHPGDRLPNQLELSETFGVSRGTVREAVQLLATEHLVDIVPGGSGGTFVARADTATITSYLETGIGRLSGTRYVTPENLIEARSLLEVPAARLAAERRQDHHLRALDTALEDERYVAERGPHFNTNQRFHSIVLEAAGNRLLSVMTTPVFQVMRTRLLREGLPDAFWARVDRDHAEIVDRLAAGDSAGAADAMREHLGRLRPAYVVGELVEGELPPLTSPHSGGRGGD